MNPLSSNLQTGTLGELIVQLRLLQFDVQSVSPHKDTGNDLLATRGEVFRALQVKTTCSTDGPIMFDVQETMGRRFHILALVFLFVEDRILYVDQCAVLLLPTGNSVT